MINQDLFDCFKGESSDTYIKPVSGLIAHPKATVNIFVAEGYAAEYYSWEGKSRKFSWFWGKGESIIPTSELSKIILSKDGAIIEVSYRKMISLLKSPIAARKKYQGIRALYLTEKGAWIREKKVCTPMEQYINLVTRKPWVFEKVPITYIASYLQISIATLKKFRMNA